MKELRNELRLIDNNENVLCKINTVTYYDEDNKFDEGETFYIHPLTGSECQTISQVLSGWSEQNLTEQKYWDILIDNIKSDSELSQKIWDLSNIYYVYDNSIDEIMTFAEASEKWGLADGTLRNIPRSPGRLIEGVDYRKSGKVWLITEAAMRKLYGEPKIIIEKE